MLSVQACNMSTGGGGDWGKYTEKKVDDSLWIHARYDTIYLDIQDFGYYHSGADSSTYEIHSLSGIRDSIRLLLTASSGSYGNVTGADTNLQWRRDTLTINFRERLTNKIAKKNPALTDAKGNTAPPPLTTPFPETFSISNITFELPKNHHIVMLDTSRWKVK